MSKSCARPPRLHHVLRASLAGCLLLVTLRAEAATFQEHYDRAIQAFKQGRYPTAITSFQAAYDLRPLPRLLYNIGLAHLRLRDGDRALFFFRLFRREEPDPPATLRAEVAQRCQEAAAIPSGSLRRPCYHDRQSRFGPCRFSGIGPPVSSQAVPIAPHGANQSWARSASR